MRLARLLLLPLLGVSIGFFQTCGNIHWGATTLAQAEAAEGEVIQTKTARLELSKVAGPLEHPWGMAFLPDGRILVTERPGRLRVVQDGKILPNPVAGVPEVYAQGQGGLLDVAIDPEFATNRLVYLSYAEPGQGGNGTAVARGRLGDGHLESVEVIFRQRPKVQSSAHFGSRLVFPGDGTLFVTLGERFSRRDSAQDLSTTLGKIVRINKDGSIPKDNPFVGREGALPEIWSYGHRNVQGATLQPATGRLWTAEHGAMGGDEINRLEAGKNYGWPVISYGVNYDGSKIGQGTAKAGMEQPLYYWDPSIAPSGLTFYTSDAIPAWQGDLLVGSLKFGLLVRLDMEGNEILREERLLDNRIGRIRDVVQGPDGAVYLLTDEDDGAIWRLGPAAG